MATPSISAPQSEFFAEWPLKECRATKTEKTPAPHQTAALAEVNAWFAKLGGDDGVILVMPTGGGKTFTAAHFLCNGPLSAGYKVLWLAHTHHLLEQAFYTFSPEMLGNIREPRSTLSVRVVSGTPGHFPPRSIKPSDDVVIATLQTVTGAYREKLVPLRQFLDSASGRLFVVFDEAHHAPAPSFRKLMMNLRAEEKAPILGLTATPTYSNEAKKGWLKKVFPQGILARPKVSNLIAQGVLAKPHFERVPTSVVPDFDEADYQKWLGTYRDIPEDVVDLLAKNAERNAIIAQTYADNRAKYQKTIIFTDRWLQCEAIVEALGKRGVKADAVYSHVDATIASAEGGRKRDRDENAKALARFKSGEIDVLVNVRMLTEGTDIPNATTVFLTRQTTSQILLTQMVGRALRGPKFGGTEDAYVVSFIDEWRQSIRWAEYDQLTEGRADEEEDQKPLKRPPLQIISIDLIKRLARQLDSGTNVTSGPFTSLMPVGWYRVTYDACLLGGDDVESRDQLIMVFDDEREGFKELIIFLQKSVPSVFGEEAIGLSEHRETIDAWRAQHFGSAARSAGDLACDIFDVARHIGQGQGTPQFFPFEVRQDHDLDAVARDFIERDLGPKSIREQLQAEYERKDRFWRTLFPRFEQLRSYYDGCQARLLGGESSVDVLVRPRTEAVPEREPSEEEKEQVKRRDNHRCLACGATKRLQVDHIVSVYTGGSNDLSNLQTLCKVCNGKKGKRTMRFTTGETTLASVPKELAFFEVPRGEDAGDRVCWERYLHQVINFTFECAAVSKVEIGARGDTFYNWRVDLFRGNSPSWLRPHLDTLLGRIQEARTGAAKLAIVSLTVTSPGEDAVCSRST